jgi:hypothetical protein
MIFEVNLINPWGWQGLTAYVYNVVKVKLSPCLIKHCVTETYGGVEVHRLKLPNIQTSVSFRKRTDFNLRIVKRSACCSGYRRLQGGIMI